MADYTTSKSWAITPPTGSFGMIFLKSQFGHRTQWPAKDIDLSGQTAIITGATTGLGHEAAKQLLDRKLARLIIAVRSPSKGEAVAGAFRTAHPGATVEVWALEMESYTSVQAFAERVNKELPRVDMAILNAGIIMLDFQKSSETGHEKVMQVNYLSTFLLAILLLPVLQKKRRANGTGPARLSIVNSGVSYASGHPWSKTRPLLAAFDDPEIEKWNPNERYWSSKLVGMLFFTKLFPHVPADDVVVNIVDPGYVASTSLQREVTGLLSAVVWLSQVLTARSLPSGATTYVNAAVVQGKDSHGCFIADWKIAPFAEYVHTAEGKDAAETLWTETLEEFKFADAKGILESLRT